MTDKLELKNSHEVVYTVDVADVNSIFYCKPTDPDILTVLMKDGKRLYCDEVCPIDSLQDSSKYCDGCLKWKKANYRIAVDDSIVIDKKSGSAIICNEAKKGDYYIELSELYKFIKK